MSVAAQGIFAACTPNAVFIRVVGRGACRNSVSLRKFGLEKLQQGYRAFYVDLRECDAMDSTFLGVFAGFGLALGNTGTLTLLDLSGDKRRAFVDLGLDQIAAVVAAVPDGVRESFPPTHTFTLLAGSEPIGMAPSNEAVDQALVMLESHEYLCKVDERNESKFKDVKQFLRQDIARHTRRPPGTNN
jgi:anti-anti-sigma regulatory factor